MAPVTNPDRLCVSQTEVIAIGSTVGAPSSETMLGDIHRAGACTYTTKRATRIRASPRSRSTSSRSRCATARTDMARPDRSGGGGIRTLGTAKPHNGFENRHVDLLRGQPIQGLDRLME